MAYAQPISATQPISVPSPTEVIYPESDGQPMADNTKQFRWILVIEQNVNWLLAEDPNVFVAGDLLWYPVEGRVDLATAPDVMVVFGRPKGDRGPYKQWEEGNLAPQVVFEIRSPSNRDREMQRKLLFYERYGIEEYYIYDPETNGLEGWLRETDGLEVIAEMAEWVSPRLGIRFDLSGEEMRIIDPAGMPFRSFDEIQLLLSQERQRAEQERQRAEQERQRAEDLAARLARYREQFGELPED
jgi:Uma2 family endonuclease